MAALTEKGYTPYTGSIKKGGRWLAILMFSLEQSFKRKSTIALITLAWLYIILRSAFFFVLVEGYLDPRLLEAKGPRYFSINLCYLIFNQIPWAFLVLAATCSGLIADDLSKKAYQVYFSHPITLKAYLCGKSAAAFFYCFIILWLPTLFFWVSCYFAMYGESANWQRVLSDITGLRFLQSMAYVALITFSLIPLVLMLSSLHKNARVVAVMFVGIFLGGKAIEYLAGQVNFLQPLSYLSYWNLLEFIGRGLFQLKISSWSHIYVSYGVVSMLFMISGWVTFSRIRKAVLM